MQFSIKKNWFGITAILLTASIFTVSCKKSFDDPAQYEIPTDIVANTTIQDLKARFKPASPADVDMAVQITDDVIIEGVVNCDDKSGNYYQQISLQQKVTNPITGLDTISGIIIRLGQGGLYNNFPVGRKAYIKCKGLWLGQYGKMLQLGGGRTVDTTGPNAGITLIAAPLVDSFVIKGALNQPLDTTIITDASKLPRADINNRASLTNTLVQLRGYQFSDADSGKTFSDYAGTGVRTLKSCTSISVVALRTSNYSNFGQVSLPGSKGNITGIYSMFSSNYGTSTSYDGDRQFTIRNPSDVQFNDSTRCNGSAPWPPETGVTFFLENFEDVANNAAINIPGWKNFAEAGTQVYKGKTLSGSSFAVIQAFATSEASVISWLVSPGIDLSTAVNPKLSFTTSDGYNNGATFKAYISTDYKGNDADPTTATWVELPANISTGHPTGYGPFVSSGPIDLSAYKEKVYIAFKYEGGDPGKTTTYELDDIKIKTD